MKQIELKLKTHSKAWLTPVLLIFIAFFAMAVVSPVSAAPPSQCLTSFCDQDGDDYYRDHKRCDICGGEIDCDDNDPENNCDGGSSRGYIQTNSPNSVIWGNSRSEDTGLLFETGEDGMSPRFCGGTGDTQTNPHPQGYLAYICHENADFLYGRVHWNTVYLDLSHEWMELGTGPGKLEATGRESDLCSRLLESFVGEEGQEKGLAIVPKKETNCTNDSDPYCTDTDPYNVGRLAASSYVFGMDESNDEPCTVDSTSENSCMIRILTRGYFYEWCNDNETKCGRLIGLEARGHVLPPLGPANPGDPTEINPFTRDQVITVEELNVYFMGIGTNRNAANCYLDNVTRDEDGNPTGYHFEDLVFRTFCHGTSCRQPLLEP